MASLRQIRANRQNCKASSGPSEQGKLASRMNALKHGMSALELVFEDDSERLQLRVSDWMPELRAVGPFQLYQLERMAAASILIDRCKEQETDYRYRLASRTDAGRDLDLSVATEDIAGGLPRRPARVARRLQQTGHGAEWLLARLRMLNELIGGPGGKGPVRRSTRRTAPWRSTSSGWRRSFARARPPSTCPARRGPTARPTWRRTRPG